MTGPRIYDHLLAMVVLPCNAAILIPYLLIAHLDHEWLPTCFPYRIAALIVGLILFSTGFYMFVQSNRLFHVFGKGTLAPWRSPAFLVSAGLYRYSRNPMLIGVWLMLAGECILFNEASLGIWLAVFISMCHIFIISFEEPFLRKKFGAPYRLYSITVPRYI